MSGQLIGRGYITIAGLKDGDPAKTYVLVPSVESVTKKLDGTLSAASVSCSVYKVTGSSAYALTADHTLSYVRTPDGAAGTLAHASGTSPSVTVLADTESIEFELSDGTNVIDRVRVPVLSDATDVNDELDAYSYLKEALAKQGTVADHGLLLTSLIALGYTDDNNVRQTLAGTNGIYVPTLGGRTVGSWWGGSMVDLFDKNDNLINPTPADAATSLIRMDGTGYFVDGLFRIKKTGLEIGDTANGYGISMGMDGRLIMGNGININIGGSAQSLAASIESVTNLANKLSNLFTPYLGNTPKTWAEVSIPGTHFDSLKVNVGLWTDSFLSCLGKSDTGGSGGGAGGLVESIYRWADLGGTFSDADNDTFNAYTLNRIYSELTAADSAISARLANFYTKSEADGRYALSSALGNYVTLNTEQTITARKNFSNALRFINTAPASVNQGRAIGISWHTTSDTADADTTLHIGSMTATDADGNISSRYLYLGWGTSPWAHANNLTIGKDIFKYKGNDILHAYNYAAILDGRYVKTNTDASLTRLTISSGADAKIIIDNTDDETNWNLISFRDKGVEYGKLGTQGGTNITWNGNAIFHGGNYASYLDQRYLLKSAYTAADVLAKIKTVDGAASGLDADLLDGCHKTDIYGSKDVVTDLNDVISDGGIKTNVFAYVASTSMANKPLDISDARGTIGFGMFYALQLSWNYKGENLFMRAKAGNTGAWQPWHQLAYTTDNVASADKLSDAAAYTAWGQTFFQNGKPKSVSGNMTGVGTITASGEIKSTAPNGFRIAYANYGLILRNDGNNSYFLLTDSGDANGNFNSLRPFLINNATGRVSMNNGMSASTATISGLLAAHRGVQIGADADTGWYRYSSRITAGNATAKGVNVGSLLVSDRWADGDKVPANGIYVKGALRIGDITISYDATNGGLHIVGGGLYADTFISALGVNPNDGSGTGGGGGMSYDRLDAWADYSADKAGYVLSALLGNDLYQNKLGKTEAQSLYQPIGNYLTAHQALDYLNVKDVRGAERLPGYFADRRMSLWFNNTGTPADGYWWAGFQVKGWDNTYGSWQLCASSHNTATRNKNLYFRVGKDDAWEAWRTILDTGNYMATLDARYALSSALANYYTKSEVDSKDYIKVIDCYKTTEWNDIRTTTGQAPLTLRAFDVYGSEAGGPTVYGNVLEIVGRNGHWQPQIWFDAGMSGSLRHRNKDYNNGEWGEWHTLLDTNNYSATLDGRYINAAGDTMTGALTVPTLNIVGSAASSAYITSDSATNAFVNVGGKSLMVWDSATTAVRPSNSLAGQVSLGLAANRWLNVYANTINVSSAALVSNLNSDLLDGEHNGNLTAKLINYNNDGGISHKVQFMQKSSGWNEWDAPSQTWYSVIKLNHGNGDTYYNRTLAFNFHDSRIYTGRMSGGTFQGWKTLAFLDDNVASATRLATTASFTAWGQIFFANGVPKSIEGNLNGVGDIGARGGAYGNFQITRGLATGEAMRIEPLDANGSWLKNCITMDTDGNLKIGSTGRATHKLHVNGYVRSNGLTLDGSHLLEWDAANEAWKFNGNLYATGGISALGITELSATEATVESLRTKSIILSTAADGNVSAGMLYAGTVMWMLNRSGMILIGDNAQSGSRICMSNRTVFGGSSSGSYYIEPTGDAMLKTLGVRGTIKTAASIEIRGAVFTVEGTEIYVTAGGTKYKLLKTAVS